MPVNQKKIPENRKPKSNRRYRGIIFDLDGTLLDTAEGVLESVRYTTRMMGYETPDEDVMQTFIGPPIKHSLMQVYDIDEEEAVRATEIFRDRYKDHDLLKASPYEGLMKLLEDLKKEGYLIGVATLKREDYAVTLLEHYHISDYCDCICGSDFASKMQKTDVLNKCLDGLNLSPGEAVLIGDTASDGNGARKAGTDLIGVTYGFGPSTPDGWKEFDPVYIAGKPADIGLFLGLEPET
ncbi:HAD hydrolase-like protein [Clostridium transplantifaecale]|uniref:HAD hydrolase-like protein n=1 Tax=Clostridium transplantifaecale TaxID=2479838 RepID=UPI000F62CCDB|nr:HAD hydrolase-like protein [Clostridium transplantifaecale]